MSHGGPAASGSPAAAASSHGSAAGGDVDSLPRIEIFGPAGIAHFLRAAFPFGTTRSSTALPIDVVELLPPGQAGSPQATSFPPFGSYRTVAPDADGAYRLVSESGVTVLAAPIRHSVPCYGYVVECAPKRHMDPVALAAHGLQGSIIKRLIANGSIPAPNGSGVIKLEDVSLPGAPGAKVVIMGDNCGAPALVPFAMNADVSH